MKYKELFQKAKIISNDKGLEEEAIKMIILEDSHFNMSDLILHLEDSVDEKILRKINKDINSYINGKAVQYIIGYTYFYNQKIKVNKHVLIPRFDTEILVEEGLKAIKNYDAPKVLDLCCGSGAIGIAVANNSNVKVYASDISKNALKVAKENSILNEVNITFYHSDLLNDIKEKFDIVLTNPPYIALDEEVDSYVINNEPSLALFGGEDGLLYYRRILETIKNNLNEDGMLLMEIGYKQANDILSLAKDYFSCSKVVQDFSGKDRVIILSKMVIK